jgi:uncharacterized protein (TIGR00369 family)
MSASRRIVRRRCLSFLILSAVMADPDDEVKRKIANAASRFVPHNEALGIRIVDIVDGEAVFELPYDAKLVGNPDTGGAITAMLDGCSGFAVFASMTERMPIATLDLRIDYLKAAEPGRSVFGRARCYKLTRNVAFTRAVAYQDGIDDVVAHAVGTFMLSTKQGKA